MCIVYLILDNDFLGGTLASPGRVLRRWFWAAHWPDKKACHGPSAPGSHRWQDGLSNVSSRVIMVHHVRSLVRGRGGGYIESNQLDRANRELLAERRGKGRARGCPVHLRAPRLLWVGGPRRQSITESEMFLSLLPFRLARVVTY